MTRFIWCLIILTCISGPVKSEEPKKAVPLVVEGNTAVLVKSFPCIVKAVGGADLYVWSYPDALKAESADNVLTITAAPQGEYKISVVSLKVDFETKKVSKDRGETTIVVGEGPKPPDPPTPVNPLTAALQKAYDSDTEADRAESLLFLKGAYKAMAQQALSRSEKTNADFVVWMKSIVENPSAGLKTAQLKNLRTAIASELATAWGANSAPLTASDAAKELDKIATALGGVK